ncbi:Wzz/FepE/Etk N-terminal domain-containing protein [Vibrio sp. WXL103]|uniref:Wzz/FepE/Etk N-terminal domain-containing protein n=1 Tax=Vibrio sp. WXL103 TaxID=3450710 RepID=UPI003EC6B0C3
MINERFEEFKNKLNKKQFTNPSYLMRQAEYYRDSEPELSERIEKRVNNLLRSKEKRKRNLMLKKSSSILEEAKVEQGKLTSESKVDKRDSAELKEDINDENKTAWAKIKESTFIIFVVIPVAIFAIYLSLFASPRYESRTQIIVQQPDELATMDAGMALLSGLGVNTSNKDTQLVNAYVYSNDMIQYLDKNIGIRKHFEENGDYFSRMHSWYSLEKFIEYFEKRVTVEVNDKSQVITVRTQAFTPSFAKQFSEAIADRAEWYINDIGHKLAQAQLDFINGEHKLVESRLQAAQLELLDFQQRYSLLNPEADGLALSKIAYQLEGQIVSKNAELQALSQIMSVNAPQVILLENQIKALRAQLQEEKERLTKQTVDDDLATSSLPVSEILTKFSDLKIELELALKAYTSSTISLEKSRIEAYRQLKYLVIVESATTPEENAYPRVIYNTFLFSVVLLMIYGVGRIILATVVELK